MVAARLCALLVDADLNLRVFHSEALAGFSSARRHGVGECLESPLAAMGCARAGGPFFSSPPGGWKRRCFRALHIQNGRMPPGESTGASIRVQSAAH